MNENVVVKPMPRGGEGIVAKPLPKGGEGVIAQPLLKGEEGAVAKPMLAGIIYGEIVFWIMAAGMVIAVPGLVLYMRLGGYLNSVDVLQHLWQGSNCLTIWKEVGNVSHPLPWYSCLGMLSKGDMLGVLGLAVIGVAAVIGMWGAFLGTLRSKSGIYVAFALLIAVVLTLSALGILKLQM